jgi:uncharacterized membrane protein
MAPNPAKISIVAGQSTKLQISCSAVQGGFRSTLYFTLSGQQPGWSVNLLANAIAPGTPSTIVIATPPLATAGTYNLTVNATTSIGFSSTVVIPVTITAPTAVVLTPAQNSINLPQGGTTQLKIASTHRHI